MALFKKIVVSLSFHWLKCYAFICVCVFLYIYNPESTFQKNVHSYFLPCSAMTTKNICVFYLAFM